MCTEAGRPNASRRSVESNTTVPEVDEETGLHLLRIGRLITSEEVAEFLAEDH